MNRNPGNIRRVKGVNWHGQAAIQNDPDFVVFNDATYGIRAMVRIFRSYEREGIDTLQEAIDRWAPPNENNSSAYVSAVCQFCGFSPHDRVSLDAIMPELIKAVIWHEEGSQPYSDQQIATGIQLANA